MTCIPRLVLTLLVAASAATACKKNEPLAEPARPAEPAPPPAAKPAEAVAEAAKPAEAKPAEATPPAAEPAIAADVAKPPETPPMAADAALGGPKKLMDPAKLTEKAPAKYKAKFSTSVGDFVVEVERDWAPNGADRFYNLVKNGFFDGARFFRAIKGFMVQFGIHGNPGVSAVWKEASFQDDPVKQSNKPGYLSFATRGPNTRTTQVFINFADNTQLDGMGFAPFGKVSAKGMTVVNKINTEYGEGAPGGRGPDQMQVQTQGNAYLQQAFPKLSYVKTAQIVK